MVKAPIKTKSKVPKLSFRLPMKSQILPVQVELVFKQTNCFDSVNDESHDDRNTKMIVKL
jgi:hypothetical protein